MTTALTVLTPVFEELNDTADANGAYTLAQGVIWLSEAQQAVCLLDPAQASTPTVLTLTADSVKQTLPAGAFRLLGISHNTDSGGTTFTGAVMGPVSRRAMDAVNPAWMAATSAAIVLEYLYEPAKDPYTFWVYPPPDATAYLMAEVAAVPAALTATDGSDAIAVKDIFIPALRQWVLSRFWGRDDERSPTYQRGKVAYESFLQLMGVDLQATVNLDPKLLEKISMPVTRRAV